MSDSNDLGNGCPKARFRRVNILKDIVEMFAGCMDLDVTFTEVEDIMSKRGFGDDGEKQKGFVASPCYGG